MSLDFLVTSGVTQIPQQYWGDSWAYGGSFGSSGGGGGGGASSSYTPHAPHHAARHSGHHAARVHHPRAAHPHTSNIAHGPKHLPAGMEGQGF